MKNVLVLIFSAIQFISCQTSQSTLSELIGKDYRDASKFRVLDNFKKNVESLVMDLSDTKYKVAQYQKYTSTIILLEKDEKNNDGKITCTIVDAIRFEGMDENKQIVLLTCRLKGKHDPTLIAVCQQEKVEYEYFKNVVKAWKVDTLNGKIKEIDTKDLDCLNIGFGND